MNQVNQYIRITPAIEKGLSWNSQSTDKEPKDKAQILRFGLLRLAFIICVLAAALMTGA